VRFGPADCKQNGVAFSARGSREVKNMALSYLMHGDLQEGLTTATSLCTQQFDEALNMTDKYGLPHHQVPLPARARV
jgi:hypothetical protein